MNKISSYSDTTSNAAEFSGVKVRVVQDWVGRGLPLGTPLEGGTGKGDRRRWNFTNILALACAGALTANNWTPAKAFKALEQLAADGGPDRLPGLPYPQSVGETLLVSGGEEAYLICEDLPGQSIETAVRMLGYPSAYTTLNVSQVFHEVCQRMGILDPGKELDRAYALARDTK